MAKQKLDNFLWINLIIDDSSTNELEVELKFDHGTDKKVIVDILESALKQVKRDMKVEHTHEKRKEIN